MADATKLTMGVRIGPPDTAVWVSKITMAVCLTTTPITPVRKKVHGRIRYGDASGN